MKKLYFIIDQLFEPYHSAAFELIQQFDPACEVFFTDAPVPLIEAESAEIRIEAQNDHICFDYSDRQGKCVQNAFITDCKPIERETFKRFLYSFLTEIYGRNLPWGSLTGIKPVKIAHTYMKQEGLSETEAADKMQQVYCVSEKKARLAAGLAAQEMPVVYPIDPKKVSVYVGVPICPAKCSYCSFVSTIADKKGLLAETYLTNLIKESRALSDLCRNKGIIVDTLYIGGGTPSIFSAAQLERLFAALEGVFIHKNLREFTFEAGRPETSTEDKLRLMQQVGVDRICLNPQSMNADTLMAINRRHTPEDIKRVYRSMRAIGFDCINMDLIMGLNNEPAEKFLHSLDEIIALSPENLTVHSLAIKKGSAVKADQGHEVHQLYDDAFYQAVEERIAANNYAPYYLYRQKYTLGSGENVGYAKPGKAGIYNILMMAEHQSIIGIGAGASGKLYTPETDRFEKVFTVKDIRTYNERIDHIIEKKCEEYARIMTSNS